MMIQYDKENIPESVIRKVRAIYDSPDFSFEAIRQASETLLGICKWGKGMIDYYDLLKIVNPKR